ncbi:hypothetical protein VP01_12544g1, partial [Puccinia sorghi]
GYEIIKKFPKTPELNSISSAITHSGQEMTPDLVLDHLCLHANKQSISGNHPPSQQPLILNIVAGCFILIFDLTLQILQKLNKVIISSHDLKFESFLLHQHQRRRNRIGSIKLSNSYRDIFLHKVLYVPDICVNLLSF